MNFLVLLHSAIQELILQTGQTIMIASALLQFVPVYRVLPPAYKQPIMISVALLWPAIPTGCCQH